MRERLPAVILAGGRATRMGGGDKPLLPLGGQPILARVIARITPQCAPVALSANGDRERFAHLGLPVLPDPLPDHPGPLAGILAGLDWAAAQGASQIVSVAGDTPFFPTDLAERLIAGQGPAGLAIAASKDNSGRMRRHPTFGLWPVALRDDLRAALEGGTRKVVLWADAHDAGTAVFETRGVDPFFNINRPEDLAEAEHLLTLAM